MRDQVAAMTMAVVLLASCATETKGGGTVVLPTVTGPRGTVPRDPPHQETRGGDPLFPDLGAPGIDVTHYDVVLTVDANGLASGIVTMTTTATADLQAVPVDARSMLIVDVTIDGVSVGFEMRDPELVAYPPEPIRKGESFDLAVRYRDVPSTKDETSPYGQGWYMESGGTFTLNEPDSARNWLPSQDTPADKATWRFEITPPAGRVAVANGVLVDWPLEGSTGPWVWEMDDPMATYLVQVLTGNLEIVRARAASGLQLVSVVPPARREALSSDLDMIAEQVAFFETMFGPYPFASYGIAVNGNGSGFALEQQGRSLFSGINDTIAAHELAHQWFGDAVTPSTWRDVWLAESFATYGEWLWDEHAGGTSVQQKATDALVLRQGTGGSPADPTVETMFGPVTYGGGALVLHALRIELGDSAFFALLRSWVADNTGTSKTTQEFIDFAERATGRDLGKFFDTWLFAADPPATLPS